MPFGLGRPVRSTLTLLILVPHAPLPPRTRPARLHVLARPILACALRSPPPPSPHPGKAAGTPKGAASALDTTPFGWIPRVDSHSAREHLANNHGAENYGKRCPEGMLGVTSALPGTRAFTA